MDLYIFYAWHGGNEDGAGLDKASPLIKTEQLRSQRAEFKKAVKKIRRCSVEEEEEDEWHLQTEYNNMPRLRNLAVEGRQPAMRGMPEIVEGDAESITKAILAMRGADKKKHKQAWGRCTETCNEETADAGKGPNMEECMRTR